MSANRIAHQVYSRDAFQGRGRRSTLLPFPPLGTPGGAAGSPVGTATLTFSDANNAAFAYTVQRHRADQVDHARNLRSAADLPVRRAGQSGAGPQLPGPVVGRAGSLEAGWGINIAHEGDTIFATWYTYDMRRLPDVAGDDREQKRD